MKRHVICLALIAAAAPLLPGPVSGTCPIASDTNIVFYGETGAGGVEAGSRGWLIHFLDWWKIQDSNIRYVELDSTDIKTDCNLVSYPNVRVYIQPGGNAYNQQNTLASAGKTNINSYIDSGRVYVGICAGFYYAATDYYFAGIPYAWPNLLGKYPTVEGSITNIATYPSYALTPVSGYNMIYYGGPATGWSQTPSGPGEALLTYDVIPGLPAVIKYNNLLLAGPHPEAYENEGITGLTTAQRIENYIWFANAINTVVNTITISDPPFSPVSTASITANWGTTFIPSGTTHYAQISTGTFPNVFSGNLSSDTLNSSAGFDGLWPNTTYYARVSTDAAGPFTDLGSTSTLSVPVSGAQIYAVYSTSITANWLPLPASPPETSSSAAEGYLLQLSTNSDFAGPIYSSSTSKVSLSTLVIAGLVPNTTCYSRVGSLNWLGAPNFTLLPSTVTLANPPGDHSTPILNLSSVSLRFQWTGNENPPGTDFTAYLSTASDFTGSADLSSQTLNAYADFFNLTGNTLYYLKARAIGLTGQSSAFNTVIATATIPQPPAPGSFGAVSSSGITANWTAGINSFVSLSYLAQISTSGAFVPIMDSSGTLNTFASFGLGGQGSLLTPNTTYYLRVQAVGLNGPGPFAALGATVTLANIPGTHASPVVNLSSVSLGFQWTENGNPAGTNYLARLSTGSGFTGGADKSADTINTLADFSGLAGNTTYYMKAQAIGRGGTPSGFGQLSSTITFPQAPVAGEFSAVTSSGLTAGW
ncbi:MAG: hypothetical protein KKH28_03055, partial [Elusimicrobia bacterium]|nr:hypothetical protein [Elusimicrobiota bacterium]